MIAPLLITASISFEPHLSAEPVGSLAVNFIVAVAVFFHVTVAVPLVANANTKVPEPPVSLLGVHPVTDMCEPFLALPLSPVQVALAGEPAHAGAPMDTAAAVIGTASAAVATITNTKRRIRFPP